VENENIPSDSPAASALLNDWFSRKWREPVVTALAGVPSRTFPRSSSREIHFARKSDIVIASPDGYAVPGVPWRLKSHAYAPRPATKSWYDGS
jgi:hypothetical protein